MSDDLERSESADSAPWSAQGRRGKLITRNRRWGGLAVFVAATAVGLVVLGGAGSSNAASVGKRSGSGKRTGSFETNHTAVPSARPPATNNSTRLLDEWAACERARGDSAQADPTVDHAVIYIAVRIGALQNWDPDNATAPCGEYLAAARRAVTGGQPIDGWGDDAAYVKYANCMRANGYPTFPYPSGIEPDGHLSTNFNGTGIDPNSPAFLNGSANQMCGKQIGAPAWWINNWGPPGSVDVYPAGANPNSPLPFAAPARTGPKPIVLADVNARSREEGPAAVAG